MDIRFDYMHREFDCLFLEHHALYTSDEKILDVDSPVPNKCDAVVVLVKLGSYHSIPYRL
jgi:hypothetical protein